MIRVICNSGVPKHIFKHKDSEHLDMLLCKVDMSVPKLDALETVYTKTGAIYPLEELCDFGDVAH